MNTETRKPLPFWLDYLKVMGIDIAIVLAAGLLLGPGFIANGFFFSSIEIGRAHV